MALLQCMSLLYLLSYYMQPEGLWQRQAAALADRSPFPAFIKTKSCPQRHVRYTGATFLLPHISA